MTHTQTFIIKLSLLFSLIILACKENKKENSSSIIFANDTVKKGFQKIDIVNPNLSFTGTLNSKEVMLNLNIREDDSVFATPAIPVIQFYKWQWQVLWTNPKAKNE